MCGWEGVVGWDQKGTFSQGLLWYLRHRTLSSASAYQVIINAANYALDLSASCFQISLQQLAALPYEERLQYFDLTLSAINTHTHAVRYVIVTHIHKNLCTHRYADAMDSDPEQ